jgi:hypothetical protein
MNFLHISGSNSNRRNFNRRQEIVFSSKLTAREKKKIKEIAQKEIEMLKKP